MSATARAATTRPTTSRKATSPARAAVRRRPVLTEVPPAPATVAGNGVFALVVVGLLVAGMAVLLGLNTSLAQGAFEINALTRVQNGLAVQQQQLLQEVAVEEAPESLQQRADALGMVPVSSPVFLRLADGAVLGTPVPAVATPAARLPVTGARVTPAVPAPGTASATPSGAAVGARAATATTAARSTDAAVADPPAAGTGIDAAVADPASTRTGR